MVTSHLPEKWEEAADSSNITLIVAHPWLQEALVRLLQEAGITVFVAETAEDLLREADENTDIALVDVSAYSGQYRDLFTLLKQKKAGILIIALLSEHAAYQREVVMRSGANGVVIKENADTELLPVLCKILAGSQINKLSSKLLDAVKKCEALEQEEVSKLVQQKEQEGKRHSWNLNRRSFLKGSAATAAMLGVVAANPSELAWQALAETENADAGATSEEKLFAGVCRGNCAGGCFLNVHVRDGKVVQTSMRELPNPEYNRICVKGLTHMQRIYHPERLKYPMKRAGERGEGKWERISWDEALSTIADKWLGYQKQFGKNAFAVAWGSGSYATCSGQGGGSATNRFLNVTGSSYIANTVDAAIGRVGGIASGWGPNFSLNESTDFKNAKTIICWGANPVVSQVQSMHFILEAKKKGTKYIVIDPIYNTNASKADMYVPIRPGTDGMLALAMMNIVLREGWQDLDFLKKNTVAPFLVKKSDGKYLRLGDIDEASADADKIVVRDAAGNVGLPAGISDPVLEGTFTINGHEVTTAYSLLAERIRQYPPEKAAEICNIPVSMIEELTRTYAMETPSTIYQYFGVDHYVNGHYGVLDIFALAMLTGNMCKPGASCGMGEMLGSNVTNYAGTLYPPGAVGSDLTIIMTEMGNVLDNHKYGSRPVNLKGVYITHANVLCNMAERQYTLDWLKKMEFVVVADMNMNETAQHADILLPVAHWFEQTDAFCAYHTHPHVLWQDKAIDPPYECKTDFQIYKLLAEKMGYGKFFNMTEEEYIALWLDSEGAKALGLTMEKLREKKALRALPGETFISYEGGAFLTPTGRAQFYQEEVVPDYNVGQKWDIAKERLPYWEPPHEAWHENPLHEKYPFHIISEHVRFRTHSQWWDVPALLEINPEPTVKINPADAIQYAIVTGDKVKLYNDRGYVVMTANLDGGVQPGVVVAPKGWEKKQFIDGHYQDLGSRYINPVCANQAFFDVLVGLEKL